MSKPRLIVGLMSGTSADGVDACLVEVTETDKVKLLAFETYPYPIPIKNQILETSDHGRVDQICRLNFLLGRLFGEAALGVIAKAGLKPSRVDLIGSHGQTIHHLPYGMRNVPISDFGFRISDSKSAIATPQSAIHNPQSAIGDRSTLQIGEPAVIAELTGITTIADFRVRDIAAGGQGAPLVPYPDYLLFRHPTKTRAVQNIGGIANVTFLPAAAEVEDVIAFDTGPGNMVIDRLVNLFTNGSRQYDEGGQMARAGQVDENWLHDLIRNCSYFNQPPPKSTGREEFGTNFSERLLQEGKQQGLSPNDIVATATALTAKSMADAYSRFLSPKSQVQEVILSGGGARNTTLVSMLKDYLQPIPILTSGDFGIPSDAKEAVAFAILARETALGRPGNIPSATGAKKRVVLGKIVPT
ncbi:MAG: anhydro-N-acetylmuramic acid kinase [bacterium]|nr:anhydro-N-acetylmuramic acid kinase [bacterium]